MLDRRICAVAQADWLLVRSGRPHFVRPTFEALRTHRAAQLEERMAAANVWDDVDLISRNPTATRSTGRPTGGPAGPARDGRCSHRPAARRPSYRGDVAARSRRSPARRHGAARAFPDAHHDRHLQPRYAGAGTSRGPDGSGAMGPLSAPLATTVAPETTPAASLEGKRPGHRGGAEGTRTPDPHTASVIEGGAWWSALVRRRRSARCPDDSGLTRTGTDARSRSPQRCPRAGPRIGQPRT